MVSFWKWLEIIFVVMAAIVLMGCAASPAADTTFLTPVPEATLWAYRPGERIENQQQAAIEATQAVMSNAHFRCVNTPVIASVELMSLLEAYIEIEHPEEISQPASPPADTPVWLVKLACDILVTAPGGETLAAPTSGCMNAVLPVDHQLGFAIMSCEK